MRIDELIRKSSPLAAAAPEQTAYAARYPANSPAVSHGMLEYQGTKEAIANNLQMMGAPALPPGSEADDAAALEAVAKASKPIKPKQQKIHVRRR